METFPQGSKTVRWIVIQSHFAIFIFAGSLRNANRTGKRS
jgi:hypothetical protein